MPTEHSLELDPEIAALAREHAASLQSHAPVNEVAHAAACFLIASAERFGGALTYPEATQQWGSFTVAQYEMATGYPCPWRRSPLPLWRSMLRSVAAHHQQLVG